jgi:hypothetical protein
MKAFTESGTYAPTYIVGTWKDEGGERHLLLVDGYAASAEAMQAASLAPMLGLDGTLVTFTSKFELPLEKEQYVMKLDPDDPEFKNKLESLFDCNLEDEKIRHYREMILEAREASLPQPERVIRADDFFPEKKWNVAALTGYMCDDPYSGIEGVSAESEDTYKVASRISTPKGDKLVSFSLRLMEEPHKEKLVFNPLLSRFIYGEDFRTRPVKISDSGRIRNELQTLCSEALEHGKGRSMKLHFDRISPDVISKEDQKVVREVLEWYKRHHPIWFSWLEVD